MADSVEPAADYPPIDTDSNQQRRSAWAVASLLCSLGIFCPFAVIIAPILGIKALADIQSDPRKHGSSIAAAGIVIGLIGCGFWIAASVWWNNNVRQPMIEGPSVAIQNGQAGDLDTFRSAFVGEGANVSDQEAADFLNELSSRYGRLQSAMQDESRDAVGAANAIGGMSVPYIFTFESGLINTEARFALNNTGMFSFDPGFLSVTILDPNDGNLTFPESAAPHLVDEGEATGAGSESNGDG